MFPIFSLVTISHMRIMPPCDGFGRSVHRFDAGRRIAQIQCPFSGFMLQCPLHIGWGGCNIMRPCVGFIGFNTSAWFQRFAVFERNAVTVPLPANTEPSPCRIHRGDLHPATVVAPLRDGRASMAQGGSTRPLLTGRVVLRQEASARSHAAVTWAARHG